MTTVIKKKKIILKKVQKPKDDADSKPSKVIKKSLTKKEDLPKKEREVKYIYPKDCSDPITKKRFRAEVRSEKKKYELELYSIKDKKSPKYIKLNKEYQSYLSRVMKPDK